MLVAAIVACEVGFWLVLAAGLLTRYALRKPRAGAVLLVCVPLVDLALLAFTVVDLRGGGQPEFAHGLAAVYLGFSVAFGPGMVRWADVRVASASPAARHLSPSQPAAPQRGCAASGASSPRRAWPQRSA